MNNIIKALALVCVLLPTSAIAKGKHHGGYHVRHHHHSNGSRHHRSNPVHKQHKEEQFYFDGVEPVRTDAFEGVESVYYPAASGTAILDAFSGRFPFPEYNDRSCEDRWQDLEYASLMIRAMRMSALRYTFPSKQ